jgi:hypothetical protein
MCFGLTRPIVIEWRPLVHICFSIITFLLIFFLKVEIKHNHEKLTQTVNDFICSKGTSHITPFPIDKESSSDLGEHVQKMEKLADIAKIINTPANNTDEYEVQRELILKMQSDSATQEDIDRALGRKG